MATQTSEPVVDKFSSVYDSPTAGQMRPYEFTSEGTKGCYGMGWQNCRVSFHENYDLARVTRNAADPDGADVPGFYYYPHPHQTIPMLVKTLTEIERAAKCPEGVGLEVGPGRAGAFFVRPGAWWGDPIRLTLLSILLRGAAGTVERTLAGHPYLTDTMPAVKHFLKGYTFWKSSSYVGWKNAFYGGTTGHTDPGVYLDNKPVTLEKVEVAQHPGWTRRLWKLAKI